MLTVWNKAIESINKKLHNKEVTAMNIGEEKRVVEFEPIPDEIPAPVEPAVEPAPAEPVKEPVPA